MNEHTRTPERDQSQSRELANALDERPHFETTNPATGQSGRAYEGHTRDEALEIAQQTRQAFEEWRRTSFSHRAGLMREAAAAALSQFLAAVNHDPLRPTVPLECLAQEAFGGSPVTPLAEPEFDRVAITVDGAVEIPPLPTDLDVSFINMPFTG